ncbi:hypothetical protein ACSZMW_02380 [Aeromonas allosaccharophila]
MNIKKMSVLAAVASISMLMTSCASPPQPTWKKEGVTDDDTLTALSQCKYEIRLNDISAEEKTKSSRIACKLKASVGESIKHVCWLPLTMATSMASVSK